MFLESSYTKEYLSEVNLMLTQEDYGNKLSDLIHPLKNHLQEDPDLLPYSLARYSGGDGRIAFFVQLLMLYTSLSFDTSALKIKTREYFLHKNQQNISLTSEFANEVNRVVDTVYLPVQLSLLQSKVESLSFDIMAKYPYIQKYFSRTFYMRAIINEVSAKGVIFKNEATAVEYLSYQGLRESYLSIGYPVLAGMVFDFYNPDSVINPKAIKWVIIEDILEIISALHQTAKNIELESHLYYFELNQQSRIEWVLKSHKERKHLLLDKTDIQSKGREYRLNLHRKATSLLQTIVLPDKNMTMLKDLLDWALSSNFYE